MSKLDVSKITKGAVESDGSGSLYDSSGYVLGQLYGEPEDTDFVAEAFNVTNETGMGPREMKEKLDEAVRLLRDARDKVWNARLDEARRWGSELEQAKAHANKHTKEFDDFLSTLTK